MEVVLDRQNRLWAQFLHQIMLYQASSYTSISALSIRFRKCINLYMKYRFSLSYSGVSKVKVIPTRCILCSVINRQFWEIYCMYYYEILERGLCICLIFIMKVWSCETRWVEHNIYIYRNIESLTFRYQKLQYKIFCNIIYYKNLRIQRYIPEVCLVKISEQEVSSMWRLEAMKLLPH